jgi:hypothetical protein
LLNVHEVILESNITQTGCPHKAWLQGKSAAEINTNCGQLWCAGGMYTGLSPLNPARNFAGSLVFKCFWQYTFV